MDDGKTFCGCGDGDSITFHLKKPCHISEVRSFAGHGDGRASQGYTVSVALAAEPDRFDEVAKAGVACDGGASELRVPLKADNVVAVRLEFANGPLGFDVYREINLLGKEQ